MALSIYSNRRKKNSQIYYDLRGGEKTKMISINNWKTLKLKPIQSGNVCMFVCFLTWCWGHGSPWQAVDGGHVLHLCGSKSSHRAEISSLTHWCHQRCLLLNLAAERTHTHTHAHAHTHTSTHTHTHTHTCAHTHFRCIHIIPCQDDIIT